MAKLILKVNYFKSGRSKSMGGYARYVATREGVEKIDDNTLKLKATAKQDEFIEKLVKDFPSSKHSEEYISYKEEPTVANASEFITRTIEDNLQTMIDSPTYADYIATRPRAERIGSHGLFTSGDEPVVLSKVSDELNAHKGNVWTLIASLRREDAERLGFDNAQRWKDMIGTNIDELSEQMRIPLDHLKWYAAFHNEGNHPHVHIIVYSTQKNEGYVTKEGIDKIRSQFAKDIFAQDMQSVYEDQTELRDKLKAEVAELVRKILNRIESSEYENEAIEQKLIILSERLKNIKGKKVYGYLNRDIKDLIDSIVDELAKDEDISGLYDLWYEKKYEILGMYSSTRPPKIPLSQNKEFKSIKNNIIREALGIDMRDVVKIYSQGEDDEDRKNRQQSSSRSSSNHTSSNQSTSNTYTPNHRVSATAVTRLFKNLANIFRDRFNDPKIKYDPKVDRRLKREDEAKRNAEILYD